jgi:hypothetical protein
MLGPYFLALTDLPTPLQMNDLNGLFTVNLERRPRESKQAQVIAGA